MNNDGQKFVIGGICRPDGAWPVGGVLATRHLDVPEDVLKANSEDAKAVIEMFRELEQRQGELFSVISEDLAAAADIFDEAIRVIDLLTRRSTGEKTN